jgi:transposase
MIYYAGLDVSLEETSICVVDETGRVVKEMRAASEPEALMAALNGIDLPLARIGLEACSLAAWLHDELRSAGLPAICIETRQANAAMKTMPNKTDRNDARALAQIMRTGWYRQVHVKSRQCRLWRSLLVARRTVLNEMRSIENVVRAVLREGGIKLGTPSRATFTSRVRELAGDDPQVMPLVEPLLAILATMLDQLGRLTKQVLDVVRGEQVCRRLMSVPGVGPITALAFRATIDRPDRFRRSRDVGAHLGLTPARYQSGETDIQGKISRCGDELARTALYEAAHTLLVRSRKWSSLRAWGMQIAKRRGLARARVAVARKLATILHRMWSERCHGVPLRQTARGKIGCCRGLTPRTKYHPFARKGEPDRSRGGTRDQAISLRVQSLRGHPARS